MKIAISKIVEQLICSSTKLLSNSFAQGLPRFAQGCPTICSRIAPPPICSRMLDTKHAALSDFFASVCLKKTSLEQLEARLTATSDERGSSRGGRLSASTRLCQEHHQRSTETILHAAQVGSVEEPADVDPPPCLQASASHKRSRNSVLLSGASNNHFVSTARS